MIKQKNFTENKKNLFLIQNASVVSALKKVLCRGILLGMENNDENTNVENKMENTNAKKAKKKLPLIMRFLRFVLCFVLTIILLSGAVLAYCAFDRVSPLSLLARNFSFMVHIESVWDTVEPLLDLQAAEDFLSAPEYSSARKIFMQLKASDLRKNKLLDFALSRNIDAAFYHEFSDSYVACVDLSFLSLLSRTAKFYVPQLKLNGLSYDESTGLFVYSRSENNSNQNLIDEDGNETNIYAMCVKNCVLVSNNPRLLLQQCDVTFGDFTEEEKKIILGDSKEKIRIVANASLVLTQLANGDDILSKFSSIVSENTLAHISFEINDSKVKANAKIPFDTSNTQSPLNLLLEKKSTVPSVLSRLYENVQYYTVINAGTLPELKQALFPILPKEKNADELWNKGERLSKVLLGLSLEDILFSWTDKEIAAFGLEHHNDPVFAIKIKDEKKRQEVFEKLASSILINDNSSLILDGIRLPCLELPNFLQGLLSLFGISIPRPYYFVEDGFIYFSESAENLSAIHYAANNLSNLFSNESWKKVSDGISLDGTVSLFYNLDRSVPFFLRSNVSVSKVLKRYALGRADLCVKDGNIVLQLQAINEHLKDTMLASGFPMDIEGKNDGLLFTESKNYKGKNHFVFWVTDKNTINLMEIPSLKISKRQMEDSVMVAPFECKKDSRPKNKELLWAVTEKGFVYLLDENLNDVSGYPYYIEGEVSGGITSNENALLVPFIKNGSYCLARITPSASQNYSYSFDGALKSSPASYVSRNEYNAVYCKGFLGKIELRTYEKDSSYSSSFDVDGIAFGKPAFIETDSSGKNIYMGFITQSGLLSIWNVSDQSSEMLVQIETGAVFNENVIGIGNYFYAVSVDGILHRFSVDGEILTVKIPNASAKTPVLSADQDDGIIVSPDGNMMYDFTSSLELVSGFPLTGRGRGVFVDVDGDKEKDFFTLSVDGKLYSWSIK